MAIENTSLMAEVNAITNDGNKPIHFRWRAEVLANNERIPLYKIMSTDIDRDYLSNFGDEVAIEFIMPAGQYYYWIHPYKENLLVTLFREPITAVSKAREVNREVDSQQFRAVVSDDSSPVVENNRMSSADAATMDLSELRRVRLQLIDLTQEQLRMKTIGTVVKQTPPGDAVKYLLTYASKEILVENVAAINGVDMHPADNTDPYKQLVIPHGTPVVDVASMVQNQAGVYNTGMGSYVQDNVWYVYPLFNHERFDDTLRNLTLINMPQNRYSGVERTYRKSGDQTIALVTGDVVQFDMSERAFLNSGNGVRFADPKRVFQTFTVDDQNKAISTRSQVNNEFRITERSTGYNYTPFSDQPISSNKFVQLSQLAARDGSFIVCQWLHSDYTAIYPGMPVKFLYEAKNQVHETQGTVLMARHHIYSDAMGVFAGGYVTSTSLLIFVNRKLEWTNPQGETQ